MNEMEWNGMTTQNGMEWNGMEWNGMEWNGLTDWNGTGNEMNGMEWNGMDGWMDRTEWTDYRDKAQWWLYFDLCYNQTNYTINQMRFICF